MTAATYDKLEHSAVLVPGTFEGRPLSIIHVTSLLARQLQRVWVSISTEDETSVVELHILETKPA